MNTFLSPMASNAKTRQKLDEFKIEGVILYLAPADLSGWDVCAWRSLGCTDGCLNTSGHGQISGPLTMERLEAHHVHGARIRKTRELMTNRVATLARIDQELTNLERRAARKGYQAVARLNGTSDIGWEGFRIDGASLMDRHPSVTFYDYTKSRRRALRAASGDRWPANYHLTYSADENTSDADIAALTRAGVNVAVVFAGELPGTYLGAPVIDGTSHDFRYRDPRGVIVGLLPKGRAKVDTSGFVRDVRPLAQLLAA
jgi:hypothetical protein